MIWITTAIFLFAGQPSVTQEFRYPDRQTCETKRVEFMATVPAVQMTPCTPLRVRRHR